VTDAALFDLETPAVDDQDEVLDLRADDSAWTSCRYCQTLTTVAGIDRRGHGLGAETCTRMLALQDEEPQP
jgi:hypothetical protein